MIVDYTAKRMSVVRPAEQAVVDIPTAAPGCLALRLAATPAATSVVAGLACTNWQTADAAGQDTVLCLTADGVMLRASQKHSQVLLEAVTVAYGPQDPAALRATLGLTATCRRRPVSGAILTVPPVRERVNPRGPALHPPDEEVALAMVRPVRTLLLAQDRRAGAGGEPALLGSGSHWRPTSPRRPSRSPRRSTRPGCGRSASC